MVLVDARSLYNEKKSVIQLPFITGIKKVNGNVFFVQVILAQDTDSGLNLAMSVMANIKPCRSAPELCLVQESMLW